MKKHEIGIAALIVAVMCAMLWAPLVDPFLSRERYRGEVRTLYENVQLGMVKEQVRHEMDSGKYPHLDFHRDGQLWLGSAPYEFGAGNWVLAIEFQGDRVSAVRVRKGDGLRSITIPMRPRRTKHGSEQRAREPNPSARTGLQELGVGGVREPRGAR